jgi:superfamily I DNA/RNA helicase
LQRLRRLLPPRAARQDPLTADEIDEIRGVLYPEIRIGWGSSGDEILRVMDLEQERLARTLGEGHRVLRGVAGSGKTVVLIGRARYLRERYPDWRILALCYNRILAEYLREVIGAGSALEVLHFHRWCFRQLEGAKVEVPKEPSGEGDRSKYWERDIPRLLLSAYERGRLQPAYHAILIDEGQDFADDWYRVVLRALDPETNSLFIAVDSSSASTGGA